MCSPFFNLKNKNMNHMLEYYHEMAIIRESEISELRSEITDLTQHVYDLLQPDTPAEYKDVIRTRVFN